MGLLDFLKSKFGVLGLVVLAAIYRHFSRQPRNHYNRYLSDTFRRQNIDRNRAKCKQFPPPYPNGWYRICNSDEVRVKEVRAETVCEKEFVVFRGEDGTVGVLDAFCPHLGTHLGQGGYVEGQDVVCPYHQWKFDTTGKNTCIPYCNKEGVQGSKRLSAKSYVVREILNQVFVWLHADDAEPEFELTILQEEEASGELRFVTNMEFDPFMMHLMEPSQNSADWYHFQTVHQWLGQDPNSSEPKIMYVAHHIETRYGGVQQKEGMGKDFSDPPRDLSKECLAIQESITGMKLFGVIPMPRIFATFLSTTVMIQGPQTILFKVDNWLLGKFRGVMTMKPDRPFHQHMQIMAFASHRFPWVLAKALTWFVLNTVEQDRPVWEHKLHIAPRNLVAGDGPFGGYGKWLDQFYSKSSMSWENNSLSW
jgi:cholesterol 7-dehydrogenase